MNEIMELTLLVILAAIIGGIGYACYKVGYSKGYREGFDMQKLMSKAFEKDKPIDGQWISKKMRDMD